MQKKLQNEILKHLQNEYLIDKNNVCKMYNDYNDCLDEKSVQNYYSLNELYEKIYKWEFDAFYDYYYDVIYKAITDKFPELDDDEIQEFITDNISYCFDKDFTDDDIKVEFCLNVGNLNYDNTCDNILNYDSQNYSSKECSSVRYLARKMRVLTEFNKAVKLTENGSKYQGNKIVEQLIDECQNNLSYMSTITFCGTMTVKDFITLRELTTSKNIEKLGSNIYRPLDYPTGKYITLPKGMKFGLWDYCMGSGSFSSGITLPKNIKIPLECIHRVNTTYTDYGVDSTCGMIDDVYNAELKIA